MSIAGVINRNRLVERDMSVLLKMKKQLMARENCEYKEWKDEQESMLVTYSDKEIDVFMAENLFLIFSGELYNSVELEQNFGFGYDMGKLLAKGFLDYGIEFLNKIDGKFSMYIYNEKENIAYIVTDRNGFFPVYFYKSGGTIFFSQSLPALIKAIGDNRINFDSLYSYFAMQSIIIDKKTLFINYEKIEKASIAIITIGHHDILMETKKYYETKFKIRDDITFQEAVNTTKELLINAVDKQTTDKNQCLWLSGGIDSSLIMALSRFELGKQIETVSIGFEKVNEKGNNEFAYSKYAAQKCNCLNREILINSEELVDNLYNYLENANEPTISNDYVGFCLLALHSKEMGYQSALSGVGADELWYGYAWHKENRANIITKSKMLHNLLIEFNAESIFQFLLREKSLDVSFYKKLELYISKLPLDEYESAILCDLDLILPEDPIKRSSNASICNNYAIHAPFLDKELVDYSLTVNHDTKLRGSITKAILKKIAEEYFDNNFIYKEKVHFSINEIKYVEDKVFEFCKNILLENSSCIQNIINTEYLLKLLKNQKCHEIGHLEGNIIWEVTCLIVWLRQFF